MHAAGRKLWLQLPCPRQPDELGVTGLGCELGLAQSRHLEVHVRVRNHVPPDAGRRGNLPPVRCLPLGAGGVCEMIDSKCS